MKLKQALAATSHHLVCQQVGDRRVIVNRRQELLTIHIQHRCKRHWIADDDGGGVRYLMGILRDSAGSYVCPSSDLAHIAQVRTWLPLRH